MTDLINDWRYGNFLIVQGRLQEAFPYLRSAATGSQKLHYPLYDLAWKVVADPAKKSRITAFGRFPTTVASASRTA